MKVKAKKDVTINNKSYKKGDVLSVTQDQYEDNKKALIIIKSPDFRNPTTK